MKKPIKTEHIAIATTIEEIREILSGASIRDENYKQDVIKKLPKAEVLIQKLMKELKNDEKYSR